MKNSSTMPLLKNIFLVMTLSICFSPVLHAQEVLSEKDLYTKGYEAYEKKDYKTAALHLFAYIQKGVAAMSDANFAAAVRKAYAYSAKRVTIGASSKGDDSCPCVKVPEQDKPGLTRPSELKQLGGADVPLIRNKGNQMDSVRIVDTTKGKM